MVEEDSAHDDEEGVGSQDPRAVAWRRAKGDGRLETSATSYEVWRRQTNKLRDVDQLVGIVTGLTGSEPKARNHFYLKKLINKALLGDSPSPGRRRAAPASGSSVSVSLPKQVVEVLNDLAAEQGKTRASLLREAVARYLGQFDDEDGVAEASSLLK